MVLLLSQNFYWIKRSFCLSEYIIIDWLTGWFDLPFSIFSPLRTACLKSPPRSWLVTMHLKATPLIWYPKLPEFSVSVHSGDNWPSWSDCSSLIQGSTTHSNGWMMERTATRTRRPESGMDWWGNSYLRSVELGRYSLGIVWLSPSTYIDCWLGQEYVLCSDV